MAKLTICWTQTAVKQRNHIFKYWNNRNKSVSYSKKLNNSIKERIQLLKTNPKLGKKTNFKSARLISLGHYSVLYKKIETKIVIIGFWDNRQDPQKLLKSLTDN